jgi:hypothetical protein
MNKWVPQATLGIFPKVKPHRIPIPLGIGERNSEKSPGKNKDYCD